MKLSSLELLNISGGATPSIINAFVKGISILIDLGKSLGSAIRRITDNKSCEI